MTYLSNWLRGATLLVMAAAMFATLAPRDADARVIDSRKYGVWEYQHFVGDIEWCGVKTNWPNNDMVLTIRFRKNSMDYFFYNKDWNLRRNQGWGSTVFNVGGRTFAAKTDTLNSNKALFGTFSSRIGDFVRRFKGAKNMKIDFPTDQTIRVNLSGSSRAVDAAVACWNRHLNY